MNATRGQEKWKVHQSRGYNFQKALLPSRCAYTLERAFSPANELGSLLAEHSLNLRLNKEISSSFSSLPLSCSCLELSICLKLTFFFFISKALSEDNWGTSDTGKAVLIFSKTSLA